MLAAKVGAPVGTIDGLPSVTVADSVSEQTVVLSSTTVTVGVGVGVSAGGVKVLELASGQVVSVIVLTSVVGVGNEHVGDVEDAGLDDVHEDGKAKVVEAKPDVVVLVAGHTVILDTMVDVMTFCV